MITSASHKLGTRYNDWPTLVYVQKKTRGIARNLISIGSMLGKRSRMPLGNTMATTISWTGLLTRSGTTNKQVLSKNT